jgi:hypothetical protein
VLVQKRGRNLCEVCLRTAVRCAPREDELTAVLSLGSRLDDAYDLSGVNVLIEIRAVLA